MNFVLDDVTAGIETTGVDEIIHRDQGIDSVADIS